MATYRLVRTALSFAFSLSLVGCFGKAPPPRTPVSLPTLVDNQEVEVYYSVECRSRATGIDWGCENMREAGIRSDNTYFAHAKYGGEQLTRAQFHGIVHADQEQQAKRYEDLRQQCDSKRWVTKVAPAFVLAGSLFMMMGGYVVDDLTTRLAIGGGVLGGGAALWSYGYLTGGNQCEPAEKLGKARGFIDGDTTVLGIDDEGDVYEKLAEAFNKRRAATAGQTATTTNTGSAPDPVDDAPVEKVDAVAEIGSPASVEADGVGTMSVERDRLKVATKVTVRFAKPLKTLPGEKYWITIVKAGSDSTAYNSYRYLESGARSIELDAPGSAGEYEIRLHGNYPTKTYNLLMSLPIDVVP